MPFPFSILVKDRLNITSPPFGHNVQNILYVKVAKTGGTSVKHYLRQFKNFEYARNVSPDCKNKVLIANNIEFEYNSITLKKISSNSFVFCTVRNPLNRFLSGWKYHPYTKEMSLDEILNSPLRTYNYEFPGSYKDYLPKPKWPFYSAYVHIFLPQTNFLRILPIENVDLIIPQERLTQDFNSFLSRYNVFRHFKFKKNVGKAREPVYISHSQADALNEIFYDDIRLLKYDPIAPGEY